MEKNNINENNIELNTVEAESIDYDTFLANTINELKTNFLENKIPNEVLESINNLNKSVIISIPNKYIKDIDKINFIDFALKLVEKNYDTKQFGEILLSYMYSYGLIKIIDFKEAKKDVDDNISRIKEMLKLSSNIPNIKEYIAKEINSLDIEIHSSEEYKKKARE